VFNDRPEGIPVLAKLFTYRSLEWHLVVDNKWYKIIRGSHPQVTTYENKPFTKKQARKKRKKIHRPNSLVGKITIQNFKLHNNVEFIL